MLIRQLLLFGKLGRFTDNHDMSRIASQLNEDPDLFMTNSGTDDHGVIRVDFLGGWQNDPNNAFTQRNLTSRQSETQQFMRSLLNWRKTSSSITQGVLKHYAPEEGVYVYFRKSKDQTVMVFLNKNPQSITLNLARFSEMLGQAKNAKDIIRKHTITLQESIQINAKTALIRGCG